jgi:hypothetical protein
LPTEGFAWRRPEPRRGFQTKGQEHESEKAPSDANPAEAAAKYAIPTLEELTASGPWRDARVVVMRVSEPLPPWCIKSGELVDTCFLLIISWFPKKKLLWVLVGFLPVFVAVAWATKRAAFYVPLNRHWLWRRRIAYLVAALLLLLGFGAILATLVLWTKSTSWLWLGLGGLLSIALGLGCLWPAPNMVRPICMTDRHIWLIGAGPGFLNRLPKWNARELETNEADSAQPW